MPTSRTGNRALIKWDPFVVFPNIEVLKPPKMDGLFHGKPYEQMDDLGGFSHYFWFNTHFGEDQTMQMYDNFAGFSL